MCWKKFFAPEPFDPVCAVKVIPGRGVGWGGKKKKKCFVDCFGIVNSVSKVAFHGFV